MSLPHGESGRCEMGSSAHHSAIMIMNTIYSSLLPGTARLKKRTSIRKQKILGKKSDFSKLTLKQSARSSTCLQAHLHFSNN